MSRWRREASERLPELQFIIASREVDRPMMLWIELSTKFGKLCEQEDPPVDLLKRIWGYCSWCLTDGGGDVPTAAALGFCEHLLESPQRAAMLPRIMSRGEFLQVRNFLEYHHTPEVVDGWLSKLW